MATDDIQRLVTGSESAPAAFKVPGNGQIQPKAIFATFDGTGAAGAFKPALKITSDAGELVGIYDTNDVVAAGASADVSWFPWLAAAATSPTPPSAAPVMPYATVSIASWTWPQGDTFVDFTGATVNVTDPVVFTNNIAMDGTTPILINKAGIYLAWGAVGAWNPAWGTVGRVTSLGPSLSGFNINPLTTSFPLSYTPLGSTPYNLGLSAGGIFPTDPGSPGELRLEVNQVTGGDISVSAYLAILRLTADGAGV